MYTVIRRYQGVQQTEDVVRRVIEEFAPQLRDQPGFQGYWVVDAGNGVVTTVSMFETEEAAAASTAAAATWVQENLAHQVPNPPRVTAGDTIAVTAAVHA
jgi:heme-degrading monooxygenase HmoA